MELKEGYKMTELGEIPEDWDIRKMGELGEVKMCRRVFNSETKPLDDIPFYKIGTFGKEPDSFISTNLYNSYRQRFSFPKKGDILISAAGTIGRTVRYDGSPAYFQDSNIVWIDNDEEVVSNNYLEYIFEIVKYETEGGTIQRLYNSILKNTKFPAPILREQTAIAMVLSDMDALIAQTEKFIEKQEAIRQGIMQQLLSPYNAEGKLKRGWEKIKIGDFGKTYGGLTGKTKSDFGNGNAQYIPFMNIMSNPIIDTGFFDLVHISNGESQNRTQFGDLFFNGSSETPEELGMCSILLENINNLYLNSFCFAFRLHSPKSINGLYLTYYFRSSYGRQLLFSLAQGATRYNLSKTNFLNLTFYIPDPKEQNEIAESIQNVDNDLRITTLKVAKLQSLKQSMMQSLLTGKIRIYKPQHEPSIQV